MSFNKLKFTEPLIVTNENLKNRCYITFYLNGKRVRVYNGNNLGLVINPNRAKTITERNTLLKKLLFETHKALESGTYLNSITIEQTPQPKIFSATAVKRETTITVLFKSIRAKIQSDLSKKYKRNLKSIYRQFKLFLTAEELNGAILDINSARIELFLNQFSSTGTYYMNKRRDLGVLFTAAGRVIDLPILIIRKTQKKKAKAKLHKAYEKSQLTPILDFLKIHNYNLYLCCLLTYCSWLRPHEEIRLLALGDFKKNFTEIHLSGGDNKGGKVRVVYIPEYAQKELLPILSMLDRNDNIFSLKKEPFNESYFNTAWSRAYKKMFALGLIYEDQTIYSFRHTAAIEVYRKTKDVYLLQKLLGHSSILVTLKYLRSLGEFNSEELRDAAPTL